MRSLNLKATISSLQIRGFDCILPLRVPNVGAFCTNRKMPLCERLVMTLPAWLASTKAEIITDRPRGSGMLGGSSSSNVLPLGYRTRAVPYPGCENNRNRVKYVRIDRP
jgi:hypothetical protein